MLQLNDEARIKVYTHKYTYISEYFCHVIVFIMLFFHPLSVSLSLATRSFVSDDLIIDLYVLITRVPKMRVEIISWELKHKLPAEFWNWCSVHCASRIFTGKFDGSKGSSKWTTAPDVQKIRRVL